MNPRATSRSRYSRHRGFTLVEILVALLLGLFLTAGLFAIEQSTRRANTNQTALATLQDEQRTALSVLTDVVQMAGYFPPTMVANKLQNSATSTLTADAGLAAAYGGPLIAGQFVSGKTASPDYLVIRYVSAPGDGLADCLGNTNTGAANLVMTSVFWVNAKSQLVCSDNDGATWVPLVNNVANFQVLYGVATSSPATSNNVDSYFTASAPPNWANVTSIRVTLTFNNSMNTITGTVGAGPTQAGTTATVTISQTIALQARAGVGT